MIHFPSIQTSFTRSALLCIHLFSDLSKNTALKDIIIESFNHSNEEVKSAASYALGNISLGNLQAYLPFVLHEIETKPKRQYLLLHSLKEVRYVDLESGIIPLVLSSFLDCFSLLGGNLSNLPFLVGLWRPI